jgi:hypothetical protein
MKLLESGLLFGATGWAGLQHSTDFDTVSTQVLRHTILSQENRKHATILRVTLYRAEVLFATSEGYRPSGRKGAGSARDISLPRDRILPMHEYRGRKR